MFICKKCGTPLEKQLPECPICHEKDPAGIAPSSVGKDFTETYDPIAPEYQLIRQKNRRLAALLAFIVGFAGVPLFYLGYKRIALWWLFTAIVAIALAIVLWVPTFYFIIGGLVAAQAGLGSYILVSTNIKDARGELLR